MAGNAEKRGLGLCTKTPQELTNMEEGVQLIQKSSQ